MTQVTSIALLLGMAVLGRCDTPCKSTTTDIISPTTTTCTSTSVEYSSSTQPSVSCTSTSAEYLSSVQVTPNATTTTCTSTTAEYSHRADHAASTPCSSMKDGPGPSSTNVSGSVLSSLDSLSVVETPCRRGTGVTCPAAHAASGGPGRHTGTAFPLPPYPLSNHTSCTSTTADYSHLLYPTASTPCTSANDGRGWYSVNTSRSVLPSFVGSASEVKPPHGHNTSAHYLSVHSGSLRIGSHISTPSPLPPYPLGNYTTTCADAIPSSITHIPIGPVGSSHPYSNSLPPYPLANYTSSYANATAPATDDTTPCAEMAPCEETGESSYEIELFKDEIAVDEAGNPIPIRFGMEALLTFFNETPYAPWRWPELPGRGNPITGSPDDFKETTCTGEFIDSYEETRASRHLNYFCNRWQVEEERLFASTSSKTTIFMCSWGGRHNCSLALWEEASSHLDRECGMSGTGYVSLGKLRIGRERPSENVTFCDRLNHSPLFDYRINQREVLVDGMEYEEWRILNRRKQAKKDYAPKDMSEEHDAPP
ncbi:hypothetical protein NLG97_g4746 [Lecanicillium saksenae]|uniref:Uncharacterized protein n=1 Tax=Lecanicillium saksenae TaxID=468837 RepID=A0ACC1QUL2_9HYPO|nr:hypothetical protein NLG97_g4746 [Lecanicillium saksenae]